MDFRRNTTDYVQSTQGSSAAVDAGLRSYMLRIYNYMASGLFLTGIVALLASQSDAFLNTVYYMEAGRLVGMKPLGWLLAFAPAAFILAMHFGLEKLTRPTLQMIFWTFSTVMGLSMANIFLVYTGESIARTFFVTAGTFGAMSIWGYTTKRDLSGMGSFLMMGVIGVFIASIVNIFTQSTMLSYAISIIGVLLSIGLTAYDTQRIKSLYYSVAGNSEALAKSAIIGAVSLYINFVYMFIMLLRLLGDRR